MPLITIKSSAALASQSGLETLLVDISTFLSTCPLNSVMVTVLIDIYAHGSSAMPGIGIYSRKIGALPANAPELEDANKKD